MFLPHWYVKFVVLLFGLHKLESGQFCEARSKEGQRGFEGYSLSRLVSYAPTSLSVFFFFFFSPLIQAAGSFFLRRGRRQSPAVIRALTCIL